MLVTPVKYEVKMKELLSLGEGDKLSFVLKLGQGPSRVVRSLPSWSQLEPLWREQW